MLKVVCKGFAVICSGIFALVILNGSALAQEFDYNVNIDSVLNIDVPPIRLDLSPLDRTFDHKAIDVSVGTNNLSGYEMMMTSSGGATNLVNESDSSLVIENLPALEGGYTDDTFVTNRWGWKVNGATNWTPFVSGLTLSSSSGPVNSNVTNLDFAAKIDYSQIPGVYSIALNFSAVAHAVPPYIQNLNPSMCTTTPSVVIDSRDNMEYTIQRLVDGKCWMTTNLNLGATELVGELNRYNTNIKGAVSAAEFNSWKKQTGSASYTEGEYITVSGADSVSGTSYGTLYNYHAASAGTVTGDSVTIGSNEDICPAGWRLPTGGIFGEFRNLYDVYNSYEDMRGPISNGDAAFTLSGLFISNFPSNQGNDGYFWSSTVADGTTVSLLHLNNTNETVYPMANYGRNNGQSIRCVLNEEGAESVIPEMQEFSTMTATLIPSTVEAMELNKAYTMRDSRDGQEYKVAKLEDGNVWMLDNLRLGGDTAIELTPADTNITSNWTLPASGTVCFYSSSCTDTSGTSGNGYTRPAINAASKDTVASTTYGNGSNKFGVYYNYCAASAGTYCYASGSGTGNATQDICPAGWRLATGGSGGEYQYLYNNYLSGFNYYNDALSIPLAGYFYNGSVRYQNTYGNLWTSTRYDASYMYKTYLTSSSVDSSKYDNRYYGNSVRCVLRRNALAEHGITTMQQFNSLTDDQKSNIKEIMAVGQGYSIRDSRDNQEYKVAKLKDGNVWMTQNLKLGKTTTSATLTTTDSDVQTTGFTLNGKLSDGKFTYSTVDGTSYQNNSSQYYCTTDYGCYYNWYTATAGAGTTSVSSGNVDYSICPKGWTLPTGGSGGQFQALFTAYGSSATNLLVNPTSLKENTAGQAPGLLLGGSYGSGGASNIGSYGYYWSRTAPSAQNGYSLALSTSSFLPTTNSGKYLGYAVRCLLR